MENNQLTRGWKPDRDEIIAGLADYLHSFEQRSPSERFPMPTGFQFTNGRMPPGEDCIWIKFHSEVSRMELQSKTQAWAHECLTKDADANARFHVPAVYDFFETTINGLDYGIIVMEFAKGVTIDDTYGKILWSSSMSQEEKENKICLYKDRVIEAICLLYSLTPPADTAPGPYGGGIATNLVWGHEEPEAPREYESVQDLQDWINSENERTDPGYPPIDLVSEDMRLCFGDMNLRNFIMEDGEDPSSRVTIVDFEHANFLPTSFLIYSSWLTHDAYISQGIKQGANLEVNEDTTDALHNIRRYRGLWY